MSVKDDLIEKIAGRSGAFGGRTLNIEISPFTKSTVKSYLDEKIPSLKLDNNAFERFYKCSLGLPFYINTFAKLLPKDELLTEESIKEEFQNVLPYLSIHLINSWARLTLQEQKIIVCLLECSLKRKDIASYLGITSGSLSNSLNNLKNLGLIISESGVYSIAEPILKAWILKEYNEKGVYPFKSF